MAKSGGSRIRSIKTDRRRYPTRWNNFSPTLANMTLDGLENSLNFILEKKVVRTENKTYVVRYADDFIVSGKTKALLEQQVIPLIRGFLKERGLSQKKRPKWYIEQGFDFLGWNVRRFKGDTE